MKHHHEFHAKQEKKQRVYYGYLDEYEIPKIDKSTAHDMSTEEPQDHPNFPKPPKHKWFNVIAIPACIWAALALIEAKYNIAQGLHPHTWELMNAATAVLLLYWSAKLFEWIIGEDYKNKTLYVIAWIVGAECFVTFIGSGLYLVKIIFEFIANFLN